MTDCVHVFNTSAPVMDKHVRLQRKFPSDVCPEFSGGPLAHLINGSKSAPKRWYKCPYKYTVSIDFNQTSGWTSLYASQRHSSYSRQGDSYCGNLLLRGFKCWQCTAWPGLAAAVENLKQQMSTRFEFTC